MLISQDVLMLKVNYFIQSKMNDRFILRVFGGTEVLNQIRIK